MKKKKPGRPPGSKSKKGKQEMVQKEPEHFGLTVADVMAHPAFVEMGKKLEEVKNLLKTTPRAVAMAVSETLSISAASGPAQPLLRPRNVEFGYRMVKIDGKEYKLADPGSDEPREGHEASSVTVVWPPEAMAPEGPTNGGTDV